MVPKSQPPPPRSRRKYITTTMPMTPEQRTRIAQLVAQAPASQAEIMRRIVDAGLPVIERAVGGSATAQRRPAKGRRSSGAAAGRGAGGDGSPPSRPAVGAPDRPGKRPKKKRGTLKVVSFPQGEDAGGRRGKRKAEGAAPANGLPNRSRGVPKIEMPVKGLEIDGALEVDPNQLPLFESA
jgi:hypothetical protein